MYEGRASFSRSVAQNREATPASRDKTNKRAVAIGERIGIPKERIRVVETESQLPKPILEQAEKEEGVLGEIVAVAHDNSVWLVNDRIDGDLDIERVILDEGTHLGSQAHMGRKKGAAYQGSILGRA
ncbi:hypothetical protein [Geoalkalibacter sp.]|uniref:hypothetical protein n=1 Tax=Geoalkalibacter sp. TaxID=3041440 RepID=UPI00272E5A3A|nr:hypothetical protein [Geoalkalibacter sp.]